MNRMLCVLGMLACIVSSSANAQEVLPQAVQSRLNDQTVLVARVDLARADVATLSKFLAGIPDPSGGSGKSAARFGQAFQALAALKVREVFLVLSTDDLPNSSPKLIVPAEGGDAERATIANSLKAIWTKDVEIVYNAVIVRGSNAAVPIRENAADERPEFATAFAAVKDSQIQIAVSLGKDARRVLQEFGPQLPKEFGAGRIGHMTEGWKWLVLGVTPSPKPIVKLIIQATDASAAESLEKLIGAALKLALDDPGTKSIFGNAAEVISLLTPSRKSDQLILSLTEADNGATRLMNGVVTPLLSQMEKETRRLQTRDHLKQIGLAMHNFHDTHKAFPAAAVVSTDGKKLLSWRVLLLPFLDQNELFKQFRLNEPWDSEHNSKLITRMPDVFASLNITRDQRARGLTTYLGPIADKTLFASKDGVTIKQITDGTSNTIMVVDANAETAVPWTKPDDLNVDLKQPLKGLTGQEGGRFWTLICDGSVRMIPDTIDVEILRRLFQINDGEPIGEF